MANSRDLLIRLLGDSSGMKAALADADASVGKHDLSLKGLAGTIGSAYAAEKIIEFGKASVEAAAADEAAQVKLATTLKNTTGATDEMVAANEDWITKTMFATGIADDELRPALARLVTSTKDVKEAQGLMGAAMDLSVGKGISLEAASNAIAKAHDGNSAALKKLGVETKDTEGKTLSFEGVMKNVNATFGGQAAAAADTTAGKLAIMKARFGELQESVGTALMPVMEQLVGILSGVAEWFGNLDEGTQTWIIRIGMLGGGLVLATRAVNGIVGPLKQFGIIGKAADGSTGGLVGKVGDLATKLPLVTAALGVAGVAAYAYGMNLREDAEAAAEAAKQIEGFVRSTSLEEFRARFAVWSAGIWSQGKHVSNNFDDMARSNLVAAKAMRDSGVVAEQSVEWQKALTDAIAAEEQAQATAIATTDKYTTAAGGAKTASGELTTAQGELTTTTDETKAAHQAFADMLPAGNAAMGLAAAAVGVMRDSLNTARDAAHEAAGKQFELNTELYKVKAAAEAQQGAWDALFGKYDEKTAFNNVGTSLDGLAAKLAESKTKLDSGAISTAEYFRQTDNAIIETKRQTDEYLQKLGTVPQSKVTEINALIDAGNYAEVERQLVWLTRKRDMGVTVTFTDAATRSPISGPRQALAEGTDSAMGGITLVGERGPELLNLPRGSQVIPNHKLGSLGGTTTIVENHFHGPVLGEADFIRRLEEGRQDAIRRGAILVPT